MSNLAVVGVRFVNGTNNIAINLSDGRELVYFCGGESSGKSDPNSLYSVMENLLEISEEEEFDTIARKCYKEVQSVIEKNKFEIIRIKLEKQKQNRDELKKRAVEFFQEYERLTEKYGILSADADSNADYLEIDGKDFYYYDIKGE